MASGGSGSPCGACKFLRRKCAPDCVFAPFFCSEQGPTRFAAIHKVFGASNVSKMLSHVPVADRCEAVVTIAYEAQARLRDPVYGCVAHIFALQQQVTYLQAQLMQMKAQLANNNINQWQGNNHYNGATPSSTFPNYPKNVMMNLNYPNSSHSSSLESIDHNNDNGDNNNNNNCGDGIGGMQEIQSFNKDEFLYHNLPNDHNNNNYYGTKKRATSLNELGELQELAFRMMRN